MSDFEFPFYEIDQIWQILGFTNRRAAIRSIRVGTFPISTYELAGRKVVDRVVLESFFRTKREEGLKPLNLKLAEN